VVRGGEGLPARTAEGTSGGNFADGVLAKAAEPASKQVCHLHSIKVLSCADVSLPGMFSTLANECVVE